MLTKFDPKTLKGVGLFCALTYFELSVVSMYAKIINLTKKCLKGKPIP